MRRWISTACLTVGLLAMSLGSLNAAVFTMHDHPDGEYAAYGDYGLRIDSYALAPATGSDVATNLFSVELGAANVILSFDPVGFPTGPAILQGSIVMTYQSGEALVPGVFGLYYEMSDLTALGGGGFAADSGTGYITNNIVYLHFTGKSDGDSVFTFANDGHRLPGDPGTGWIGRGWLQNFQACDSADLSTADCQAVDMVGTNDFLMTGTEGGDLGPVPEPSTMLLTMGGVALLWWRKRIS